MEILCFYAGIACAYVSSRYSLLLLAVVWIIRPNGLILCFFLSGLAFALIHQQWKQDRFMPSKAVIPQGIVQGKVSSIPSLSPDKTQFQFSATQLNGRAVKALLLLDCYKQCSKIKAGELWQFPVKLKRPRNLSNPGRFDFVSWLNARHIHWIGSIKPGAHKINSSFSANLLGLREHLADSLEQTRSINESFAIIQALTVGVTNNLTKAQWDLFRRTGTTHLMVISGAHISLVAGFAFWCMKWLWTRSRILSLFCPSQQVASLFVVLIAAIYALFAGFGAPAQRALLVCFLGSLRYFLTYRLTTWQMWRYALFAVVLYEPHVVLLTGFYLSFLAVDILLLISQRIIGKGYKKIFSLQVACLLGLIPLTLYWYSYGAINGLFANLLAIPLVGFIIIPLALLSLLVVQWVPNSIIMLPVHFTVNLLLTYLQWIDSLALINLNFSLTHFGSVLGLLFAMLLFLLFPTKSMLPATITLFCVSLFPPKDTVKQNEVRINILDVGQGLGIVVSTANHTLIYDTGMKFYHGGDMARLAIIPYLMHQGIKKLDKVIISHPDLDHRGGLASLESTYPIDELLVDDVTFYRRGHSCHRYPDWQWDGINFHFFPIEDEKLNDKNNHSCVLQIQNGTEKILFTGDIERKAEDYLRKTYGQQLASEVSIVPHHGSKTSSSVLFIQQVSPKYAVVSAGFDNRYRFPHAQTLKTLKAQQATLLNTIDCGMVTIKSVPNKTKTFCYTSGL